MESRSPPLVVDVSRLPGADLGAVDALARLALAARRSGRLLVVRGACRELRGLLDLTGLRCVVRFWEESYDRLDGYLERLQEERRDDG